MKIGFNKKMERITMLPASCRFSPHPPSVSPFTFKIFSIMKKILLFAFSALLAGPCLLNAQTAPNTKPQTKPALNASTTQKAPATQTKPATAASTTAKPTTATATKPAQATQAAPKTAEKQTVAQNTTASTQPKKHRRHSSKKQQATGTTGNAAKPDTKAPAAKSSKQ